MSTSTARRPARGAGDTAELPEVPRRPPPGRPRLPQSGYHLARTWFDDDGNKVTSEIDMPVNSETLGLAGRLWVCSAEITCDTHDWVVGDNLNAKPTLRFCPNHGAALTPDPDTNPEPAKSSQGGPTRLGDRAGEALAARRAALAAAAAARRDAAVDAAMDAARRKREDLRDYTPSAAATAATLVGTTMVVSLAPPVAAATAGAILASAGAVVAYIAAYLVRKQRAIHRGERTSSPSCRALVGARRDARRVAAGVLAAGSWATLASVVGVDPAGWSGTTMLGLALVLGWVVNHSHWQDVGSAGRARKAEQFARQLAADEELAWRMHRDWLITQVWDEAHLEQARRNERDQIISDTDEPGVVGRWLAGEWDRIAGYPDTRDRFPAMPRTRIRIEETRPVRVPLEGVETRVGWEFVVEGDPGVLVPARGAIESPMTSARMWLAAMLERDEITVSVVDRPSTADKPHGDPNRALLILTDGAPLGGTVKYLGAAGIDRRSDGSIWAVDGRDITGKTTWEPLYVPMHKFGGLVVGHSGGGKSQGIRRRILSSLYGGIYPLLYDPKNFVDYAEFAGIFPMGCTTEHRDIILRAMYAEMLRRQKHLSKRKVRDRHGRDAPTEARWDLADGPPLLGIWDEFHLECQDKGYVAMLTALNRLERATASGNLVSTQGGGLNDLGDSVLRGLLGQTGMEVYRMPLSQARLAGYSHDFDPSHLPHLPGMLVKIVGESGPLVPMRSAFIPRGDVEGAVYDHLYAPSGELILPAPQLPAETIEVFQREGLMDLLKLAQGEGGLERLQAEVERVASIPPPDFDGQAPAGRQVEAHNVILTALARGPVLTRAAMDSHNLWRQPMLGWLPNGASPSTISRAVVKLTKEGLVSEPGEGGPWRVLTPKGQEPARRACALIDALVHPGTAEPASPAGETEAETETRLVAQREQEAMVAAALEEAGL